MGTDTDRPPPVSQSRVQIQNRSVCVLRKQKSTPSQNDRVCRRITTGCKRKSLIACVSGREQVLPHRQQTGGVSPQARSSSMPISPCSNLPQTMSERSVRVAAREARDFLERMEQTRDKNFKSCLNLLASTIPETRNPDAETHAPTSVSSISITLRLATQALAMDRASCPHKQASSARCIFCARIWQD